MQPLSNTANAALEDVRAAGGTLTVAARREALHSALAIIGRYFTSGKSDNLQPQSGLSKSDASEPDELLDALQFRVALAAAGVLIRHLQSIARAGSFRYGIRSIDVAGAVTGQIDIARYATRFRTLDGDAPTYPVLDVNRNDHTPENVLATYAAVWILRELADSVVSARVPSGGPDYALFENQTNTIRQLLRLPRFRSCIEDAKLVGRHGDLLRLIAAVDLRLQRREVFPPRAYTELTRWVKDATNGQPIASPGDLEWLFYDDRFDTKLFELWCMHELAQAISRNLHADLPPLGTGWRAGKPAFEWSRSAGTISLYFQKSMAKLGEAYKPQWILKNDANQRYLGAIPDLVVELTGLPDFAGSRPKRIVVIDPKLKQRKNIPTEEIYKILGYAHNCRLAEPTGAILYYSTNAGCLNRHEYAQERGSGRILAIEVNPLDKAETQIGTNLLATVVLDQLGITQVIDNIDGSSASADEIQYRVAVRELEQLSEQLPAGQLAISCERVRAFLTDARWTKLTHSQQTMLATAEHLGFTMLARDGEHEFDYSGPVIGVCAAIESILHDNVITPADTSSAVANVLGKATLGAIVKLVKNGITRRGVAESGVIEIGSYVRSPAIDTDRLLAVVDGLRPINWDYRIPAAHREVLTAAQWKALWAKIYADNLLNDLLDAVALQ